MPLSPPANDALRAYLRQRLAAPFDTDPSAALLCWGTTVVAGTPAGAGLGQAINRLFVAADVLDAEGRHEPPYNPELATAWSCFLRFAAHAQDATSDASVVARHDHVGQRSCPLPRSGGDPDLVGNVEAVRIVRISNGTGIIPEA